MTRRTVLKIFSSQLRVHTAVCGVLEIGHGMPCRFHDLIAFVMALPAEGLFLMAALAFSGLGLGVKAVREDIIQRMRFLKDHRTAPAGTRRRHVRFEFAFVLELLEIAALMAFGTTLFLVTHLAIGRPRCRNNLLVRAHKIHTVIGRLDEPDIRMACAAIIAGLFAVMASHAGFHLRQCADVDIIFLRYIGVAGFAFHTLCGHMQFVGEYQFAFRVLKG